MTPEGQAYSELSIIASGVITLAIWTAYFKFKKDPKYKSLSEDEKLNVLANARAIAFIPAIMFGVLLPLHIMVVYPQYNMYVLYLVVTLPLCAVFEILWRISRRIK